MRSARLGARGRVKRRDTAPWRTDGTGQVLLLRDSRLAVDEVALSCCPPERRGGHGGSAFVAKNRGARLCLRGGTGVPEP